VLAIVDPSPRFHRSFLAALDEFVAAGEDHYAKLVIWPVEDGVPAARFTRPGLESRDEFARYTDFLLGQRLADAPRPAAYVAYTEMWIVDGAEYVGKISLRHELNDLLFTWGGHIGYAVRPSARRRGCATRALSLLLPVCAARGIDPVLVTCDVDNAGSRRTIEKNGGVYEDTREGKLRFWVSTRGH
jgi:predicted acetyltransferase